MGKAKTQKGRKTHEDTQPVTKSGKDRKKQKSLYRKQEKEKAFRCLKAVIFCFDGNSKSVDKGSTASEIELEPCTQYKIKVRPFYSNLS